MEQNTINCTHHFSTLQIFFTFLKSRAFSTWKFITWRISPHDNLSYGKISPYDRLFLHKHRLWCLWQIWTMTSPTATTAQTAPTAPIVTIPMAVSTSPTATASPNEPAAPPMPATTGALFSWIYDKCVHIWPRNHSAKDYTCMKEKLYSELCPYFFSLQWWTATQSNI